VVVLREGRLSSSPYENLYSGRVLTEGGASWFDTGRIRIAVPPGFPEGGPISIRPDEILLSREPLKSSARNVFPGRLTRIEERWGGVLDVTVEAGESFTVRVTRESFADLKLTVGAQIYIAFKSTAVKAL
jgi:molybdopterin-binding protein